MENSRVEKNNNLIKACIILLIIVVVMETIFVIKTLKKDESNNMMEKELVVSDLAEKEVTINAVKTPLVDFVYGFEAVDGLKVSYNSEEPYEVTFLADLGDVKNIEILKFYFDDDSRGIPIGIINDRNGQRVKVSVTQVKFDDSFGLDSTELTRVFSVQEELLDTIVSNFEIVEYVSEDVMLEEEYVLTETPYFKIPFSKEWEEYLCVEKKDGEPYQVVFSCQFEGYEPVELFTYMFGEGSEGVLGYLGDMPVGLSIGTAEADKNWDQEQTDIFYNMREEMNYIIDHLAATGEFSFN